jgi:hypothetical protein
MTGNVGEFSDDKYRFADSTGDSLREIANRKFLRSRESAMAGHQRKDREKLTRRHPRY